MIVPGSANPLLLGQSTGYNLTRSLRFRASASANLRRTFSTSGTNNKIQTISVWLKRGALSGGSQQVIFGGIDASIGANQSRLVFQGDDTLNCRLGGAAANDNITSAVFRDPSACYHIFVAIDTTQATAANRVKIYVNGVQQTVGTPTSTQNQATQFANATSGNTIGEVGSFGSSYFDGYMAEFNFIDGQALTPSSFGATNAQTGVWQPKKYSGTYGTNGFYLPFTDNSALTSGSNAGLGKDFSGNGNYWNTNNISITSGSTYDSMTDVPTLTSATAANFATLNPLDTGSSSMAASNGNLTFTKSGANFSPIRGTLAVTSGKYYFEMTANTSALTQIGVCNDYNIRQNGGDNSIQSTGGIGAAWDSRGFLFQTGTSSSYAYTFTTNDVVMVAFDASSGKIWFGKNGAWNTGNPATDTSPAFTASGYNYLTFYGNGESGGGGSVNFGQRPFAYTPPTGYVALNTFNLPTPTIGATTSTQASKYMDINLYTGTGSTLSITNSGFQPDFTWIKSRSSGAQWHALFDIIRGTDNRLFSNTTDAQDTTANTLTAFNSNGFTLGSQAGQNTNGGSYVAWQWKANGSGSSNTAGSITSTVSANTSAGFSVVTYTGTGANATVGHGLGVAPQMVIVKNRQTAGTSWKVYHIGLTSAAYAMELETTGAEASTPACWNSTAPTSTVVNLGSNAGVNQSSITHVMYCFAPIAGYSKFGKYTGNGSTDGPFVYCGFRPKYVMIKRTDTTGNWIVHDTARSPYNVTKADLFPNLSNAEETTNGNQWDMLSNGFKFRDTNAAMNASGGTYIYAAFAEVPTKFSLAQ